MIEALKQALEALEEIIPHEDWLYATYQKRVGAITAIKEALAQRTEQEPVGKFSKFTDGIWSEVTDGYAGIQLYKEKT